METLQGTDSAVMHKVQQLLIARERSNRYYAQQEVERELGLERGEIGKFYRTMHHGEGGKKKATTLALLKEAGVFRIKRTKPKGKSTLYWIAFAGKGPAKRRPPPFFMSDAEHVFEFKDYTSHPAASVESDMDLEKAANEADDTPSGHTPPSCTVMARSRRRMVDPPPAADGACASQNMGQPEGQTEVEMRTELRQLSIELSKCETALESHGSYLGITDPAILLDQLKALRRKDEQLREMLLMLLRASPLQAPKPAPSRLANAAALLLDTPPSQAPPHKAPSRQAPRPSQMTLGPTLKPPSPTAHALTPFAPTPSAPTTPAPTPPVSTPASGRAVNRRRSCTLAETHARRKRARVAATNASAAASASAAPPSTSLLRPLPPSTPAKISTPAAALTPSPLWSSSCPSHLTPRPKTTPVVPPGKILSLYEALDLTPPLKTSAPVSAPGQSARTTGITNNGSGDTSRSSTPPAYFPGRHTLYRANIPRGWAVENVGGSANGGNPPGGIRGKVSSSSPAAGLRRRGHGAGIGGSNGHAELGRSPATTSASSTTIGRSSDEGPKAPEREAPANPPKSGDSASGGEISLARGIGSSLAGAGAGQGSLEMATEMATVALAGPAEERATVRDLAEVAMAFNTRRNRVSSPAPGEGQECAAGSSARDPSTNDVRRDGDKRMVAEGRGTTAIASLGAAASTGAPPSETGAHRKAVATAVIAAGKMVKKEMVELDGNGGDEAVKANPVRYGHSASSSRGTREGQRRTPTRPLRIFLRLNRSSAAAIAKPEAPKGSTNPSSTCSADAQAGISAMQQGVEAANPPASASVAMTPPGNAAPSGKSESAFGGNGVAKKSPVGKVPAEPDADAPRRGNGNDEYGGRPPRKRRKSAQTGGWRSRYNADEFELGGSSSPSMGDSDGESDGDVKQPRDGGVGDVGSVGTRGNEEGDTDWDKSLGDVGRSEDSDEDAFGDDGGRRVGDGGGMRLVRKPDPPNAWNSRRDAGMGNVTQRHCRKSGCNHQPSFNMEGQRAMYCRAHKRNGMVNVKSKRCNIPGCMVRSSFGFDGDTKATYCDAHKKPGMVNVRTGKSRNVRTGKSRASRETRYPSSTTENERSKNGSIPRTEDAASAAAAAAPDLPCSIAQDPPLPLPLAAKVTPAEVAAAVPAPTSPRSGIDDDEVDRIAAGGGSSGTCPGGPREEGAVSSVPGVSSG